MMLISLVHSLIGHNESIYLMDIHIFYTVLSAICGFLTGARDRLGEINSVEAIHKLFEQFPFDFMENFHVPVHTRIELQNSGQNMEAEKQLKFFQSSVAAAFSERDQALIEEVDRQNWKKTNS